MCGIVGITSTGRTVRLSVEALKRLEYRGYDSFGVAVLVDDAIICKKSVGSVIEYDKAGFFQSMPDGRMTIAHTRWATHGGVTEENAHPHLSFDGAFALVHNGIIENHQELRNKLLALGVKFLSQTDTEVIVHLLAIHYRDSKTIMAALQTTLSELRGEYAVAFMTTLAPGQIFGARYKSPLAYGVVDGLGIMASDQRAIGPLTSEMTFLDDGDIVVLCSTGAKVYAKGGLEGELVEIDRPELSLPWSGEESSLEGHKHYMIKEIREAPIVAEKALNFPNDQLLTIVDDLAESIVNITGVGTPFYVSEIGQYYFADLADTYARTHPADEFLALISLSKRDHLIAVSQSGETFDTLEVIRAARQAGARVTSINNVYGSSAQRLATFPIFQAAGAEECVLSTKSIVSQSVLLYRLAAMLGRKKGLISDEHLAALISAEGRLSSTLDGLLNSAEETIRDIAYGNKAVKNWFFIGRGIQYPVAMESALKFKEVSYRHAEGMPAGFLKHGTISLIDEDFYTVAFLPDRGTDELTYRHTISNISEIHARGGNVIAIGHNEEIPKDLGSVYRYVLLPALNKYLNPVLQIVAGQLLAYHCASFLKRNIDRPRALAKSVTVR